MSNIFDLEWENFIICELSKREVELGSRIFLFSPDCWIYCTDVIKHNNVITGDVVNGIWYLVYNTITKELISSISKEKYTNNVYECVIKTNLLFETEVKIPKKNSIIFSTDYQTPINNALLLYNKQKEPNND